MLMFHNSTSMSIQYYGAHILKKMMHLKRHHLCFYIFSYPDWATLEPSSYEKQFACGFVGVTGRVPAAQGVRQIYGNNYNL